MMPYRVITAPTSEPIGLADVKLHLRLTDDTTDDPLLTSLIERARRYCEKFTVRAFACQKLEAHREAWPGGDFFELPMPPLVSITSLKYLDSAGTETTMTATTQYLTDADSEVGRVVLPYGINWPTFISYPIRPIRVRYVAGYTTLPEPLKQAMLLLIGNWYENREDAVDVVGGKIDTVPFGAKALMAMYRVRWL